MGGASKILHLWKENRHSVEAMSFGQIDAQKKGIYTLVRREITPVTERG